MCGVFDRGLLTLVNGKLVISYPLHIVVCKLMIELKGGYLIYGVLDEKILTYLSMWPRSVVFRFLSKCYMMHFTLQQYALCRGNSFFKLDM